MANVIEIIIRAKDQSAGAFRQASQGLSGLGSAATGLGDKLGGIGAAIGPMGVAAGIAAAGIAAASIATKGFLDTVKQGADAGDALNKIAQQTGLTVEEVSRLKFAATQSNTSIESLNTGIRFLSRNMFEAQRGGKEQAETLRELGFSGREAEGHLGGTSSALLKIADRLQQVEDPGTRTALAMRIFGRSAQDLVPFLSQGSGAIKALGDEADRTGVTVSTAAAKLGDAYNDSLSQIDQQFTGIKTKIAEAALPALIQFTEVASDGLARVAGLIDRNKEAFAAFAGVVARFGEIALTITVKGFEIFDAILAQLKAIADHPIVRLGVNVAIATNPFARETFKASFDGARRSRNSFADMDSGSSSFDPNAPKPRPTLSDADKKAIADAIRLQSAFTKALQESYLVADRLGLALKDMLGVEQATKFILTVQEGLKAIVSKPLEIRVETAEEAARKESKALGQAVEQSGPLVTPEGVQATDQAADNVERILDALLVSRETAERLRGIFVEAGEAAFLIAAGFEGAWNVVKERLDPLRNLIFDLSEAGLDFVNGVGAAAEDAFKALFVNGDKFIDTLANFGKTLIQLAGQFVLDIGKAIVKALILKAILGSIGGGFGFLNKGGTAVDTVGQASTGGTARLNAGGSVAHLNAGGSIVRMNQGGAVVHAAGGVRVVPGPAQAYDSVPAMLAPGEVVLPTIGGKMPGDLLASLAQLGKDVAMLVARPLMMPPAQFAAAGAPVTYHIAALDAASIRTMVRRGDLRDERILADDPARD